MTQANPAGGDGVVVAELNYLVPMAQPLRTYTFDPPDGSARFNGKLQPYAMPIGDARTLDEPHALDLRGFALVGHRSAVRDFWDEAQVRETWYREAERLIVELTGASRALVFDHTLRRRAPGRPPLDGNGGSFAAVREPVGRVHADYTPVSAPARVLQVLGEDEGRRRLRSRYAILGLWRPTGREPLRDAPLALVDARSVGAGDMVCNELVYPQRRGETYVAVHNPQHRWYFVPRQTRDEVIVFKNFDSRAREHGGEVAGVTPHTAFDDPTMPPDAPLRESIELRAFAFFDD